MEKKAEAIAEKKEIKTAEEVKQMIANLTDLSTLKNYSLTSYNKKIARQELLAKGWEQADINVVWPVQNRKPKAKKAIVPVIAPVITFADVEAQLVKLIADNNLQDDDIAKNTIKNIQDLATLAEERKEKNNLLAKKKELEDILKATENRLADLDKAKTK